LLLRSAEIKPLFYRFVPFKKGTFSLLTFMRRDRRRTCTFFVN